ncbi:hypothetical protein BD410DRAFT_784367 [Rickenella mellea]|uniref:Nucleolar protein 12 n=1 Tax=Rickenella mellea TaxID=50990 RepID=A0A4Y7QHH0_9AGAM|nr:hypothetical protein BD410DRAFT_784367 [Rickenella mellea]
MNSAILSHSHKVIKAKKKAKQNQIKEIVFDDSARYEFLTGFRKRNLLKKEAAVQKAKERERQARLEARREQRQLLKEQALENAAMVEKAYRDEIAGSDSEEEFTGFSTAEKGKAKQVEDAYEDEEQLATVTVIEEFDPDTLIHPPKPTSHSLEKSAEADHKSTTKPPDNSKPKSKTASGGKKKVKYETKAGRKAQHTKERARKKDKAERAGGKRGRAGGGNGARGRR